MASLTLHVSCTNMLCVTEEHMVREVVDLCPFYRLYDHRWSPFGSIGRIKPGISIKLLDFRSSVYLVTGLIKKLGTFFITLNGLMTIHAHIYRRYRGVPAFPCITVTV